MVGGFCLVLLFLFVPETFWDRTPRPKHRDPTSKKRSMMSLFSHKSQRSDLANHMDGNADDAGKQSASSRPTRSLHVGFAPGDTSTDDSIEKQEENNAQDDEPLSRKPLRISSMPAAHEFQDRVVPRGGAPETPALHNFNSPAYSGIERSDSDYMNLGLKTPAKRPEINDSGKKHSISYFTSQAFIIESKIITAGSVSFQDNTKTASLWDYV